MTFSFFPHYIEFYKKDVSVNQVLKFSNHTIERFDIRIVIRKKQTKQNKKREELSVYVKLNGEMTRAATESEVNKVIREKRKQNLDVLLCGKIGTDKRK